LYRIVLGIDSDAPGFSKVKIEPHLGDLKNISGSMPHPQGTVFASYRFEKKKWMIELTLPKGVTGDFVWQGKTYSLRDEKNVFQF
jgi:hypothetical protein